MVCIVMTLFSAQLMLLYQPPRGTHIVQNDDSVYLAILVLLCSAEYRMQVHHAYVILTCPTVKWFMVTYESIFLPLSATSL